MNVVVSTLNAKYIHTSLALRCLKAFCQGEFDVRIAEYTIKDPAMNIVSDLYGKRPDVLGFSCYIWNIEETIVVIKMLKKILPDLKIVLGGAGGFIRYGALDEEVAGSRFYCHG